MKYSAHDILMGMGEARLALNAANEALLDRIKANGWSPYHSNGWGDPPDGYPWPTCMEDAAEWEAGLEYGVVQQARAELARWKRRARAYHAFILTHRELSCGEGFVICEARP